MVHLEQSQRQNTEDCICYVTENIKIWKQKSSTQLNSARISKRLHTHTHIQTHIQTHTHTDTHGALLGLEFSAAAWNTCVWLGYMNHFYFTTNMKTQEIFLYQLTTKTRKRFKIPILLKTIRNSRSTDKLLNEFIHYLHSFSNAIICGFSVLNYNYNIIKSIRICEVVPLLGNSSYFNFNFEQFENNHIHIISS